MPDYFKECWTWNQRLIRGLGLILTGGGDILSWVILNVDLVKILALLPMLCVCEKLEWRAWEPWIVSEVPFLHLGCNSLFISLPHIPFSNGPLLKDSRHFFQPPSLIPLSCQYFWNSIPRLIYAFTKISFVINFSTGQREMMKTYLEIMSIIPILKQFANLGRRCRMINYFWDFSFLGQLEKFRASTPLTENPRSATLFDFHKII